MGTMLLLLSALLVPHSLCVDLDERALRRFIKEKEVSFDFGTNFLCNCTTQDCDHETIERFGNALRGICISDALCSKFVELSSEDNRMFVSYQCVTKEEWLPPGAPLPFVCLSHRDRQHLSQVHCCNYSFCNGQSKLALNTSPTSKPGNQGTSFPVALFAILPFVFLVALLALIACHQYRKAKSAKCNGGMPWRDSSTTNGEAARWSVSPLLKSGKVSSDISGSGSGGPSLMQRTIANQVQLVEPIGQGRFGQVFRAEWLGESVAVKIFSTRDETSFYRELDIFLTCMLRHPNIVEFKGADNKDTSISTQLWLLTEYHQQGSLFDVLETTRKLDINWTLRLLRSLANGLAFLHTELEGTHSKPAIAHRDLKTKNLLVKKCGQIAIADFGLAVRQRRCGLDLPLKVKAGTVRYLAPEVLDGTIGATFDAYRSADIYSVGLVLWEVLWRMEVNEHKLPYYDRVSCNPSEEEMLNVVVCQGCRPQPSLTSSAVSAELYSLAAECWTSNPFGRNHALVLRNAIDRCALRLNE